MKCVFGLKLAVFAEAFRLSREIVAVEASFTAGHEEWVALARAKIKELAELSEAIDKGDLLWA